MPGRRPNALPLSRLRSTGGAARSASSGARPRFRVIEAREIAARANLFRLPAARSTAAFKPTMPRFRALC